MGTVTVSHVETSVGPTGVQVQLNFSDSIPDLVPADFRVNGVANFRYESGSGHNYNYRFSTTNRDEPGYVRIFLPRTAVTPNLDSDLDWTFYWGSDNVISHGATASVRASRPTATLTNVHWVNSTRVTGGETRAIEFEFSESVDELQTSHMTITGDITSLSSFAYYLTRQEYRGNVTLPSDLGDGGEIRIRVTDLEAFYPGLAAEEDWTLSWDADGNLSASRTADLPVVVTGELSETYVSTGIEISVTFRFSKDVSPFLNPFQYFNFTDGITPLGVFSFNDRHYGRRFRVPTTGAGQGVVSFPRNVLPGGNNAVTLTFDYIDEINAEISLSAASAQNSETVIAQFDFDAPVPNFSASAIEIVKRQVLAANRKVLAANGKVLYVDVADAVVGSAMAIDDALKCWTVPIELPQAGEGEIEVRLPEDAIGFYQSAVEAPIFYAPQISLNIPLRNNLILLAVIGKDFKHDINITGNNISYVNVTGLLRPFYYEWNPTTGVLSILGRPTSYYKDLEFTVSATDRSGTTTAKAKIDVVDVAPVIQKPSRVIFIAGATASVKIDISNNPSEVSVVGPWANLDHKLVDGGVMIEGEVPEKGISDLSGHLIVNASNSGGDALEMMVPYSIGGGFLNPKEVVAKSVPGGIVVVDDEIHIADSSNGWVWRYKKSDGAYIDQLYLRGVFFIQQGGVQTNPPTFIHSSINNRNIFWNHIQEFSLVFLESFTYDTNINAYYGFVREFHRTEPNISSSIGVFRNWDANPVVNRFRHPGNRIAEIDVYFYRRNYVNLLGLSVDSNYGYAIYTYFRPPLSNADQVFEIVRFSAPTATDSTYRNRSIAFTSTDSAYTNLQVLTSDDLYFYAFNGSNRSTMLAIDKTTFAFVPSANLNVADGFLANRYAFYDPDESKIYGIYQASATNFIIVVSDVS